VRIEETTVAGAVFAPALNELFTAALGGRALLNNVPIHPSDTTQLDAATVSVVLTSNYDSQTAEAALRWIRRLAPKTRGVRIFVSEALELCYLACGRLDANLCPSSGFYSAAAASLIAGEAGCVVTSLDGAPYQTGRSKNIIAAANTKLHADLILLLAEDGTR
jgi:myo-inositol-1(or 4)-monophosphatase